jgi:hypothetical protein
MMMTP